MKRVITIIAIIILIIFAYNVVKNWQINIRAANQTDAIVIDVATVEVGKVPRLFETFGGLVAKDRVSITPQAAGQITNIYFSEGSEVEQGAQLIRLDSAVAAAELRAAEADLGLAQQDYERLKILARQGVGSQQELDQQLAQLQEKRTEVAVRRERLQQMVIYAPFAGVLGARRVSIGEYVTPGKELVEIIDTTALIAEFSVPSRYLDQLAIGQSINIITDAFPDASFTGEVSFIAPAVDEGSRSVIVRATVDNEDKLLAPGLFITIQLQIDEVANALLVPIESLVPTIEGPIVYKVIDNTAIMVAIKIGTRFPDKVEVISGLTVDDLIISAGQQKVRDGSVVTIRNTQ